jgi:zinc protease
MPLPTSPIEITLSNGLKIVALDTPQATGITCMLNYQVSRLNESAENAGINMALLQILQHDNLGNQDCNLKMFVNYSAIIFSVKTGQLNQCFEHVAKTMAAPVLSEQTLKLVVQSHTSHRRTKQNYMADDWMPVEFNSTCHPIGWHFSPTLTPDSAARIDISQVKQWHQQYYSPGNARLIIAGNLKDLDVETLAKKHFDGVPRRPIAPALESQPPCAVDNRYVLHKVTSKPRLLLVLNMPGLSDAVADRSGHTLNILARLLGQKLSTLPSVSHGICLYEQHKSASLFRISVSASKYDQCLKELEADIQTLLDEIKLNALPADELETARQRELAKLVKSDDHQGLALEIGQLENYKIPFNQLNQRQHDLLSVTAEDIQRAARTYFSPQRTTVVHILPMQTPSLAATTKLTLSNGLKVIILENPRSTKVVCAMNYKVSNRDESTDNAGITTLLYGILVKDPHFVAARQFIFWNYNDFTQCIGTSDVDQLDTNFKSLAGIMSAPTLANESMRTVIESYLERRERNVLFTSNYATPESFDALTFPVSGYGNTEMTPASAAQIDLKQVQGWHQNFFTASNACLVVVGNVKASAVGALARKHFDALPNRTTISAPKVQELSEPGERRTTLRMNTKTPRLLVAFNVPGLIEGATHHSAATLQILSALFELNYEGLLPVSSGTCIFNQVKHAGLFRISLTAKQADQSLEELETALLQLIEACKSNGFPQEQLELARERAIEKTLSLSSDDERVAYHLFKLEDSQLPLTLLNQMQDNILAVSDEDIQRAASTWLTSRRMTVAHILPMQTSKP